MSAATNQMLYDDSSVIGPTQLERIIQSLVWVADRVLAPASGRIDASLPQEDQNFLTRRLIELREADLLQLWDFEPSLIGRSMKAPSRSMRRADEIRYVDSVAYERIYSNIIRGSQEYRARLLFGQRRGTPVEFDGISEIVSFQSALWTLLLADHFEADQIMTPAYRTDALGRHLEKSITASQLVGPVIQHVMKLSDIGSLAHLEVKDIIRLRRKITVARSFVLDIVQAAIRENRFASVTELAESAKGKMYERYIAELNKEIPRPRHIPERVGELGAEAVVDILAHVWPPLLPLKLLGKTALDWGLGRARHRGIVWFVADLRSRVARRAKRSKRK